MGADSYIPVTSGCWSQVFEGCQRENRSHDLTPPLPLPISLCASKMTDVSNGYVSSDELLGVNEAPFNTSAASNNSTTGMAMLIGYCDRGGGMGDG